MLIVGHHAEEEGYFWASFKEREREAWEVYSKVPLYNVLNWRLIRSVTIDCPNNGLGGSVLLIAVHWGKQT